VAKVDVVVIGAGAVGLAIARAFAMQGHEVLILEAEPRFGSGISSRNSEVIHAGLYYEPGSLKARTCLRGRDLLLRYCAQRRVPHAQCGKLIVAVEDAQVAALHDLQANAEGCGVTVLRALDREEVRRLEPQLRAVAALHSPVTAILDSHAYMTALLADAEADGARLVCNTAVGRVRRVADGWGVCIGGDAEPAVTARWVVNAAGLGAQQVAERIEGAPPPPPLHYAKGNYFGYAGRTPFARLIYPLPEPGGLGVHLTLDLAGRGRFGPDVEWLEEPDYEVSLARRDAFADAIRRWWPEVETERLQPDYTGVRPKLSGPGEPAADFRIEGPAEHGLDGLVNLFGIESPGLTASLAIAELVAAMASTRS
jgi:L-2-hydroxyglutarate oxidase LhgO